MPELKRAIEAGKIIESEELNVEEKKGRESKGKREKIEICLVGERGGETEEELILPMGRRI